MKFSIIIALFVFVVAVHSQVPPIGVPPPGVPPFGPMGVPGLPLLPPIIPPFLGVPFFRPFFGMRRFFGFGLGLGPFGPFGPFGGFPFIGKRDTEGTSLKN